MLALEIFCIVLITLGAVFQFALDHWLKDRRKKKYRLGRKGLLFTILLFMVFSVLLAIARGNTAQRNENVAMSQRDTIRDDLSELKQMVKPVAKIAEEQYPLLDNESAYENMATDFLEHLGEKKKPLRPVEDSSSFQFSEINHQGDRSVSRFYSTKSPLSGWHEGLVRKVAGKTQVRFDDESIKKLLEFELQHPGFPWPKYFLAEAYHLRGESENAFTYARRSLKIFEVTTTLEFHSPDHDDALIGLMKLILKIEQK